MSIALLAHNIIVFLYSFKYFVLFIGTIVEGPVIMVASGFLIHTGFLDLFPAFIIIMIGDLVGDVLWYGIGYYIAGPILERHGRFLSITPELFEKAKELFHKYHARILLISKITIGFGMALAILVAAGATRVSFKKYMFLNAIGEVAFVAWMLAVGYFFGGLYLSIPPDLKLAFTIFWIIAIAILIYKFTKYMKRKIAQI